MSHSVLQCSFHLSEFFEFNLTEIKYALFPVRNKVLLAVTSNQKGEQMNVRMKVNFSLLLPLEISSS